MNREAFARWFRRAPVAPPRPAHRQELEEALLQRFEARASRQVPWLRLAAPALVVISLLAASAVPAEYLVEVGKRITVVLPSGSSPPPHLGERLAGALHDERAQLLNVAVRIRRSPAGEATLVVEVWGDRLAEDEVVLQRLQAIDGLAQLTPRVEKLEGRVRDNLLDKVGHRLFRMGASPAERELARQKLIAELQAAEGPGAEVEVQLEEGDRGQVRVKVRKERPPAE